MPLQVSYRLEAIQALLRIYTVLKIPHATSTSPGKRSFECAQNRWSAVVPRCIRCSHKLLKQSTWLSLGWKFRTLRDELPIN